MPKRTEIETILRDEVERARQAYQQAHKAFTGITADIPSGLPEPDGTDRIRNAGNVYRSTMNTYSDALRDFNNFVTDGIVPERLKKDNDRSSARG